RSGGQVIDWTAVLWSSGAGGEGESGIADAPEARGEEPFLQKLVSESAGQNLWSEKSEDFGGQYKKRQSSVPPDASLTINNKRFKCEPNSMALAPIILAVTVVALIFYWKQIYTLIRERMRLIKHMDQIPGPYSIPILGTTWLFKWDIAGLAMQLREWGNFYANQGHGLVRLWMATRPMVICIRPETAKLILESSDTITKGEEYGILTPWLGTGLLISTGEKWRTRRKLLTPAFHFKVLNDFQVIHDRQAKIFVGQLEKMVSSEKEFDIFPFVKRCALDIILRYASSYGFEYDRHLKIVTDFTRKVINERIAERGVRKSQNGEKKAFLDLLLDVQAEGNLSYEDIREEVDTFMFEGHDTTASSMGWTLWCLSCNPQLQKRLHEEMDEIFEGVMIPKGCSIMITPAMIHANAQVYKDPLIFDPERFSEENIQKRHPYAYIPFSAGPRNCIGEDFIGVST
ncbi:unspecific monooxygenase, partial [Ostertagia ostertagi]